MSVLTNANLNNHQDLILQLSIMNLYPLDIAHFDYMSVLTNTNLIHHQDLILLLSIMNL